MKILIKTAFCLLLPTVAHAQVIPRPVTPPPRFPPEIEELPPLEEVLPPSPVPVPSEVEEIPIQITVRQFEVIGSTIFTQEQLEEVLRPYVGRPITFAELIEAQTQITQLYIDRGYITSGAVIPPQALQDGVVVIEVLEGGIEEIQIIGLTRLRPFYINNRLKLATQTPVNQQKLLTALQLLQLNPLIDSITAELSPGTQPGTSILRVEIQESPAFSLNLAIDNWRSPSVGSVRGLATIRHQNLLGFGDRFTLSYYKSEGSDAIDELSYFVPVNSYNGTVGFRFYYVDNDLIEPPFDQLDITSDSTSYDFIYRQPIIQTPRQELALGFNLSEQSSNLRLPLDSQRNLRSRTDMTILRFSQEYFYRTPNQVFAIFSQLNLGVDSFSIDFNGEELNSQFFIWRGQAQYLRNLSPNITLAWRLDLQLADQPIPSLEKFALGGVFAGRGYRENILLGDNGVFSSAELRFTVWRNSRGNSSLQLVSFFDFGNVWNQTNFTPEINTLYSVGTGLRLVIQNRLSARLDWGIPLVNVNDIGNSLQEQGLYFRVDYQVLKF